MHDEIITFGKYKGNTLVQIAVDDPSYIVWIYEDTEMTVVPEKLYQQCKKELYEQQIHHEAIMESRHGNWGNRDD